MSPWVFILINVVCIVAFILFLTFLSSLLISRIARKHSEKTMNASIRAMERMLPGKNCGACGCETCQEYAKAIFICQMDADKCPHGRDDLPQKLNAQMEKFLKSLEDDTPKREEEQVW